MGVTVQNLFLSEFFKFVWYREIKQYFSQGVDTQPVLVTSVLFHLRMDTYYGEVLVRDTC